LDELQQPLPDLYIAASFFIFEVDHQSQCTTTPAVFLRSGQ
jgi:hypothetical protein